MDSNCVLLCTAAAALFGSMLYVSLNPTNKVVLARFLNTLTPDLQAVYHKSSRERMQIYLVGLTIGLLLGFIYLRQYATQGVVRTCGFVFIVLSVTYLFYFLWPKSVYLVPLLTTQEQRAGWRDVYRHMQRRHYMGMVLGAVSYLLVSQL